MNIKQEIRAAILAAANGVNLFLYSSPALILERDEDHHEFFVSLIDEDSKPRRIHRHEAIVSLAPSYLMVDYPQDGHGQPVYTGPRARLAEIQASQEMVNEDIDSWVGEALDQLAPNWDETEAA